MVSRATLFLQPGGDTIQITKTAQYINKVKGISVDIKTVSDKIDYINYDLIKYLSEKEYIFIFVTFLIGRESPCYQDTLTKQGENWDYGRLNINNPLPLIELIYNIFLSVTSGEEDTDIDSKFSERDIKCIKHPSFLKMITNPPKKFSVICS